MLDEQSGDLHGAGFAQPPQAKWAGAESNLYGAGIGSGPNGARFGDSGGASRFFPRFRYEAKASTADRDEGCEDLYWMIAPGAPCGFAQITLEPWEQLPEEERARGNVHSTVKPTALIQWLVRLVTPPGGLVVDPFTGSGTTGVACVREGFDFTGIELHALHTVIADARIEEATRQPRRPLGSPAPKRTKKTREQLGLFGGDK